MHWIDLYFYSSAEHGFPENKTELVRVLDEHEKTRLRRFAFDHLKWTFATSRWILKTAVASKLQCLPEHVILDYNQNGKPFLASQCDIEITISHTDKHLVVALSDTPIGVDIEHHHRRGDPWRQPEKYLNDHVADALNKLSSDQEKEQSFSRYWTAMEALVKLLGSSIFQEKAQFGKDIEAMNKDGVYQTKSTLWQTQKIAGDAQLTLCSLVAEHKLDSFIFDGKDFLPRPIFV